MSKKLIAIICLLLTCLLIFGGCSQYAFTALEGDTSGAVTYRGSTVIVKGAYTYFINGAANYTDDNTFGDVVKGGLARVKTSDIGKEDAKVEIVVPKILYKANADSTGFIILGNKIYYSSPSTTKDKNSNLQTSKLDIMSVNLDGTGTKRLLTLESNSIAFYIMEQGGKVFLTYLEGDKIYTTELTADKISSKEVCENVITIAADVKNSIIYFTQGVIKTTSTGEETEEPYNLLKKTTPDGTITEMKSGKKENPINAYDGDNFAVVKAMDGVLYYTVSNTTIGDQYLLQYKNDTHSVLINTIQFTQFLIWNNSIVSYNGEGIKVISYDKESESYSSRVVTVVNSATLHSIDNNTLYFVSDSKLYSCNLYDTRKEAKVLIDSTMSVAWATFEIVNESGKSVIYFFNSSADLTNYMYRAYFEDDKIVEERLAILTEDDIEWEEENL